MDEEKRGNVEGPNLSSSHDRQIAQKSLVALFVPTPSNANCDEWDI